MLNLTRGLRRDPPLVRTMTVVGERNRGRAVQCAHSQIGPGQRHGSGGGGWRQPGLTSSEAGCRGSERARLMTEEHCSGSGTGPGHARHARQERQGTYLKVAALARQQRVRQGARVWLKARARARSRGGGEGVFALGLLRR